MERWRQQLPNLLQGPQRNLFTEEEHAYCMSFPDPASHYAGRWCAKEAIRKALPPGTDVDMRRIQILPDATGAPRVQFLDLGLAQRGGEFQISIAHTHQTAMAIALRLSAG